MTDVTHAIVTAAPGWQAAQVNASHRKLLFRAALDWTPVICWHVRTLTSPREIGHVILPVTITGSDPNEATWVFRQPDGKFIAGGALFDDEAAMLAHLKAQQAA
jgi:hypothetical protein